MYDNHSHVSPELLLGLEHHIPGVAKMALFIGQGPNMSGVGAPPKAPSVPAATVGTKSIPATKPIGASSGAAKTPGIGSASGDTQGAIGGSGATKAAFLDAGIGPLLAGAAGGGAGYLAGAHLINPIIAGREDILRGKIQSGEKMLGQMQSARKAAPWIAGAVGALLLASLAAKKARADEREKIETRKFWMAPENQALVNEIQGAREGFSPNDLATINQQYPFY